MNEQSIFEAAIECVDKQAREDLLNKACGGDAELRLRVDRLLKVHDESSDFLEKPVLAVPSYDVVTERLGAKIGDYKLLEQIGEGGMGVVYMAAQQEPVKRKVALKIIKPGRIPNR